MSLGLSLQADMIGAYMIVRFIPHRYLYFSISLTTKRAGGSLLCAMVRPKLAEIAVNCLIE